jgi:hypothetical protein
MSGRGLGSMDPFKLPRRWILGHPGYPVPGVKSEDQKGSKEGSILGPLNVLIVVLFNSTKTATFGIQIPHFGSILGHFWTHSGGVANTHIQGLPDVHRESSLNGYGYYGFAQYPPKGGSGT